MDGNREGFKAFNALVQRPDGGFALVGWSNTPAVYSEAAWIVRVDNEGTQQWSRTIGGTASDNRYLADVSLTPTADYATVGYRSSSGGGTPEDPPSFGAGWYLRIDDSGTTQVDRAYSGFGDELYFESVAAESDGEITAAGDRWDPHGMGGEFGYLQKMDVDGERRWANSYSAQGGEFVYAHVRTRDCGYALAGTTGYPERGWLVKTDEEGTERWQETYGAGEDCNYGFADLVQSPDGGYVIAGTVRPRYNESDGLVLKVDASGNEQWDARPGGSGNTSFDSIARTSDGGYVLGGTVDSSDQSPVGWVVKTDATGTVVWERRVGANCESASVNEVVETHDGSYSAAGTRRSSNGWEGWIFRLG